MTETAHLALSPLEHISECMSQQNLTAKYSESLRVQYTNSPDFIDSHMYPFIYSIFPIYEESCINMTCACTHAQQHMQYVYYDIRIYVCF